MAVSKLSTDLYSELRSAGTPMFKRKGSILFRVGQPVRGAYLIRSGQVKMRLQNAGPYPSRTLASGRVIGLPATFSGEPYSLTAEAKTDCNLDFIPRARLLSLLRRNPKLGYQIVRMLSEEIFQMRKAANVGAVRKSHGCK